MTRLTLLVYLILMATCVPGRKLHSPSVNQMIIMSWNGFPTIFLPSKRARLGLDISSLNRIMKRNNTGDTRWRGLSKREVERWKGLSKRESEHYSAWKRLTKRQ